MLALLNKFFIVILISLFPFSVFSEEKKDTIEVFLSDKQGRWYGKGVGNIRERQVKINIIMI